MKISNKWNHDNEYYYQLGGNPLHASRTNPPPANTTRPAASSFSAHPLLYHHRPGIVLNYPGSTAPNTYSIEKGSLLVGMEFNKLKQYLVCKEYNYVKLG